MLRSILNHSAQKTQALESQWNQQSRLLVAIQNNNIQAAASLLQSGIDADLRFSVGTEKRPAICLCVERGHLAMAELLLEYGCSINQYDNSGFTPLHIASSHGHTQLTKLLLKNRANVRVVSNYGHTPLHLATQHSSLDIVRLLVTKGSDIDKRDRDGLTPLAIACSRGSFEVAEYLLAQGADPNATDRKGNTPLLHAVSGFNSHIDLVQVLLSYGAKVNVTNTEGETPLLALIRGTKQHNENQVTLKIVISLVKSGCQLDVLTPFGQSALHLAAMQHQDRTVELLARVGCDPNTRDVLGLTPLFLLAKEGKSYLVDLLQALGVNMSKEKWISNMELLNMIEDPNLQIKMMETYHEIPSLKLLCRTRLRKSLGVNADTLAVKLNVPPSIVQYLKIAQL